MRIPSHCHFSQHSTGQQVELMVVNHTACHSSPGVGALCRVCIERMPDEMLAIPSRKSARRVPQQCLFNANAGLEDELFACHQYHGRR